MKRQIEERENRLINRFRIEIHCPGAFMRTADARHIYEICSVRQCYPSAGLTSRAKRSIDLRTFS